MKTTVGIPAKSVRSTARAAKTRLPLHLAGGRPLPDEATRRRLAEELVALFGKSDTFATNEELERLEMKRVARL